MRQKILILGIGGMLGHRLFKHILTASDYEAFGTTRSLNGLSTAFTATELKRIYNGIDVNDFEKVVQLMESIQPHSVINCVGIVKQRHEAKDPIPSIEINALFPHQLASLCQKQECRLIHLSTDCVFSGTKGNYTENDLPDPVDLYGRTKLLGELNQTGCLTLRTSIIGWELVHRTSLLEWFASQRGQTIKGYCRAIYTGLSTTVLSKLILDLVENHPDLSGLYHVASLPITKYELLERLRDVLDWKDMVIEPDEVFHCDRSLIGTPFEEVTGWFPPSWDEMIRGLASEWTEYQHQY